MNSYNQGKKSLEKINETKSIILKHTGLESANFKSSESPYYSIIGNFTHHIHEGEVYFAVGGSENNSGGPKILGSAIFDALQAGLKVNVIIDGKISKSNRGPASIFRACGVKIISSEDTSQIPLEFRHATFYDDNKVTLSNVGENGEVLPTQNLNMLALEFLALKSAGYDVDVFDILFQGKLGSQQGISERIRKQLKSMSAGEYTRIDVKNTLDFSGFVNKKEEIEELRTMKVISSESGYTERDNLHDIELSKLKNNLIDNKPDAKILKEHENGLDIDLLVIEDNKIIIYEAKSFVSRTYAKGLGQLLIYKERTKRLVDSDKEIELILYVKKGDELNIDFISACEHLGVKIENFTSHEKNKSN